MKQTTDLLVVDGESESDNPRDGERDDLWINLARVLQRIAARHVGSLVIPESIGADEHAAGTQS